MRDYVELFCETGEGGCGLAPNTVKFYLGEKEAFCNNSQCQKKWDVDFTEEQIRGMAAQTDATFVIKTETAPTQLKLTPSGAKVGESEAYDEATQAVPSQAPPPPPVDIDLPVVTSQEIEPDLPALVPQQVEIDIDLPTPAGVPATATGSPPDLPPPPDIPDFPENPPEIPEGVDIVAKPPMVGAETSSLEDPGEPESDDHDLAREEAPEQTTMSISSSVDFNVSEDIPSIPTANPPVPSLSAVAVKEDLEGAVGFFNTALCALQTLREIREGGGSESSSGGNPFKAGKMKLHDIFEILKDGEWHTIEDLKKSLKIKSDTGVNNLMKVIKLLNEYEVNEGSNRYQLTICD